MLNIMRASFYRFSKTKDLFYAIISSLAIGLAMGFTVLVQGENLVVDMEGSIDNWMFFDFCIIIVLVSVYIGGDFKSKVIYYELMSGHARESVVIGRMIPCLVWSILILTIGLGSTFSFGLKVNGWLEALGGIGQAMGRYFLLILNALPFVVMCVIVAFLAKGLINAIALEWFIWMLLQLPLILQGAEERSHDYLNEYLLVPHMRQIITMPLNVTTYLIASLVCLLKCSVLISIGLAVFKKNELL